MIRIVATVVAVLLFLVAAAIAHGTLDGEAATVGYVGLAFLAAAQLPWRQ